MRPHAAIAILALAVLGLAACGGPAGVGDTPTEPADDLAGSWELLEGTGPDGGIPLVDGHPITLVVDRAGGTLGGTAACNSYGGDLRIDGTEVTITELFATEMACMPDEVMASERAYLTALMAVDGRSVDTDRLVLTGDDVELTFVRMPEPEDRALVGTTWVLDTLIDGDTASSIPDLPQPVTLALADDGTFQAFTGCNTLDGHWEDAGERVGFSVQSITDVACPDLEDLQEHVVDVLDGEVQVEVAGDRLVLTADDGRGLSYRAEG